MMTRSSMVYSLLLDFHHSFTMTPVFFWASLFAMNLPLLMEVDVVEGLLVMISEVLGLARGRRLRWQMVMGIGKK